MAKLSSTSFNAYSIWSSISILTITIKNQCRCRNKTTATISVIYIGKLFRLINMYCFEFFFFFSLSFVHTTFDSLIGISNPQWKWNHWFFGHIHKQISNTMIIASKKILPIQWSKFCKARPLFCCKKKNSSSQIQTKINELTAFMKWNVTSKQNKTLFHHNIFLTHTHTHSHTFNKHKNSNQFDYISNL